MSEDKSGSPPCGIYLRIDDFSNMLDLIGYVRQMAFAINRSSGYERNMAVVEIVADSKEEGRNERVADLLPIVKDQGLVALVSGLDSADEDFGADGVVVSSLKQIELQRAKSGEDAIIGVVCANQSDASKALSTSADCVIVGTDPKVIATLSAGTEAMLVARGKGITNKNCGALAMAGANFVDVSEYLLGHEKGVMQATVNILHELDLITQRPSTIN